MQAQKRVFDETGRRIVSEGQTDPATPTKDIAGWQTHPMGCLADAAKDYTKVMLQIVGNLIKNEVEAMKKPCRFRTRRREPTNQSHLPRNLRRI
ncbi:hypothetical protein [Pseudooceanicola sp.]|uniref:hypothetical protein n=1 Tax=Pseudooceanicola sp. TaxID=1914328 RepID=UPI002622C062|nr:hypothetical protein [Pseudooceanicola sp.]MDF1856611.1 hypothetical protein [Pseudooceanicola sp.]